MISSTRWRKPDRAQLMLAILVLVLAGACQSQTGIARRTRAVTVEDGLGMTRVFEGEWLDRARGSAINFSPDKKHFFQVLVKGNVSKNKNEYSHFLILTYE